MPNRLVRDASNRLVPKIFEGGLSDSIVVNADVKNATLTNDKLVNSTIQAGKISYFKSTEQVGNGSEQDIAHGLGRVPSLVIVQPTELTGIGSIVEGTHDGTNVKVTAVSGDKYKVIAL